MSRVRHRFHLSIALLLAGAGLAASAIAQSNDAAQANSHDDAWEVAWAAHSRDVYRTAGKTPGMVIHVGDSITHANPYTQWPRRGSGKTAEDREVLAWSLSSGTWPDAQDDASHDDGWYLAGADTSGVRGMTAASGIDTSEMLRGEGNGGAAMPKLLAGDAARLAVADGAAYSSDLQIDTVAAAFERAQVAVVMLGTNDATAGRSGADFIADLAAIVRALEARNIVVILSTIPPHPSKTALAEEYNARIRTLAAARALPLIDFHAEVLSRRPGSTWNGTLLGAGDVHPSAQGGGYNSASNPYADGGDAATHRTGEACRSVGYLLRSWLTVQKLKEVRARLEDAPEPEALPGDCNGDGDLDVGDAVCLLGELFAFRAEKLPCGDGGVGDPGNRSLLDWDGDGAVGVTDAVLLLRHLFLGQAGHALGGACSSVPGCVAACAG